MKTYWAVMPKYDGYPAGLKVCRIEKAETAAEAIKIAFGLGPTNAKMAVYDIDRWLAKDLGPNLKVVQSNKRRMSLLNKADGWIDPYEHLKAEFPDWERYAERG